MLTKYYKDKIIILLRWSSFNPEGLCGEVEKKKYNTSGGLIDILPIPLISDQTFFNFMAFCLKKGKIYSSPSGTFPWMGNTISGA